MMRVTKMTMRYAWRPWLVLGSCVCCLNLRNTGDILDSLFRFGWARLNGRPCFRKLNVILCWRSCLESWLVGLLWDEEGAMRLSVRKKGRNKTMIETGQNQHGDSVLGDNYLSDN
ncbi:hypothetical protein BDW67DRAFT_134193 [Aspergillus spinulosporus]